MGVYDDTPLDASTLKALKEYKKQKAKEQVFEEIDLFAKKEIINNQIPDNGLVVNEPTEDDADDVDDEIITKKDYTKEEAEEILILKQAAKDNAEKMQKEIMEFANKKEPEPEPEPTPEPIKKVDLSRVRKIKRPSRVIYDDDEPPKQEPKQEPKQRLKQQSEQRPRLQPSQRPKQRPKQQSKQPPKQQLQQQPKRQPTQQFKQ